MRILVVEDERWLCNIIKRGILEEGYAVDTVYDAEEGEYLAETTPYDLVILDIMLPNKDGIEVCQELRLKRINTPILMLTAKDTVQDRVRGLDAGAGDYLLKPFAFNELLARVRALLRREGLSKSPRLQVADLVILGALLLLFAVTAYLMLSHSLYQGIKAGSGAAGELPGGRGRRQD